MSGSTARGLVNTVMRDKIRAAYHEAAERQLRDRQHAQAEACLPAEQAGYRAPRTFHVDRLLSLPKSLLGEVELLMEDFGKTFSVVDLSDVFLPADSQAQDRVLLGTNFAPYGALAHRLRELGVYVERPKGNLTIALSRDSQVAERVLTL